MTTLQKVLGDREWESKYGRMVSVKLDFGDFQAELNTKPETLSSRLEMCEAWIGKESSEWAFEDKGTWNNGNPKPKKVLSWPGKMAYSGAQEPRRGPNTRSVDRGAEQPSILASVALKAAVEIWAAELRIHGDERILTETDILETAGKFYSWLRETSGSASAQTHTADPSFRADPDPPSAAEAHSGPSAGPSTSAAAEDSDPGLSPFTGSDEQDEEAPYGEGGQASSSCSHTYRTDPNELGVRVCVKCGDKRKRSA